MKVLIFKAVEICNSNCIYCDVIEKGSKTIMSLELLELVFRKIDEYLKSNDEEIQLIWHGGEPCLLGVDYFKKAYEFQEKERFSWLQVKRYLPSHFHIVQPEIHKC